MIDINVIIIAIDTIIYFLDGQDQGDGGKKRDGLQEAAGVAGGASQAPSRSQGGPQGRSVLAF